MHALGVRIGAQCRAGDLILLNGPLGAQGAYTSVYGLELLLLILTLLAMAPLVRNRAPA